MITAQWYRSQLQTDTYLVQQQNTDKQTIDSASNTLTLDPSEGTPVQLLNQIQH